MTGDTARSAGHPDTAHDADYAQLLGRLAEADVRHRRERAQIEDWYRRQCVAARDAVASRAATVDAARAAVTSAEAAVRFTDAETVRLWRVLANRLGRPVARLGPVPSPDEAPDAGEHPGRVLDRVRELLDEVRPARHGGARPALVVLVVLALAVAAVAVATALR